LSQGRAATEGSSRHRVLPLLQRLGWGVADQAVSSVTNFTLGILVARSVSPRHFGAFSIAFVIYTTAMSGARAIVGEPLSVRYSASRGVDWERGTRQATGASLVVGVIVGLACVAVRTFSDGVVGSSLLILGITMPGLLLQDAWRYAFFTQGRGFQAFLNDSIWALVLFVWIAALSVMGHATLDSLIFAWGGAACIAAVAGIAQARLLPRPGQALTWWSEQRDLAPRFFGEFAAGNGSAQVLTYATAAAGGLSEAGALRGAQLLLGPINVFTMGIGVTAVPAGVRLLEQGRDHLKRAAVVLSACLAIVTLAWGMVIFFIPDRWGTALLHDNWFGAHAVIFPLTLAWAGLSANTGGALGLRALAAAKRSLRVKIAITPVSLIAVTAGAFLDGAVGAAYGLAISTTLGALLWWFQFGRALSEDDSEDEPLAFVEQPGEISPLAPNGS
jgi:O-antigen/teichoic acid export membrane protein